MTMYLVLCYDRRPGHGWFAWSVAMKTRKEAEKAIERADYESPDGKPIKYKILEFWMPADLVSA